MFNCIHFKILLFNCIKEILRSYATTYNSIYRLCARFKHLGRPISMLSTLRSSHTPFFPCHIRHHPVDGNTSHRRSPFRLEILRHIIQLKKNNPNSINRRKRVINNINHIHTDTRCARTDKATRLNEFPRREHTADDSIPASIRKSNMYIRPNRPI